MNGKVQPNDFHLLVRLTDKYLKILFDWLTPRLGILVRRSRGAFMSRHSKCLKSTNALLCDILQVENK